MAEFLQGNKLNAAIEDVFEDCREQLIIISPFIKLHPRYRDCLKGKLNDPELQIIIVFGKNEEQIHKSFSMEDFEFFREFPNVVIKYEPRLHAKYYATEKTAILSSMNLYDYSQNNNIEFGIRTSTSFVNDLKKRIAGLTLDYDAYEYFRKVYNNSETLFEKDPIFEKSFFSKKYIESNIISDKLTEKLVKPEKRKSYEKEKTYSNFQAGYCIRTGEKIAFNPDRPLSESAFRIWNNFQDYEYQENFCHFSGEPSNGETCYSKPILRKNWKKSQEFLKATSFNF